VGVGKGASARPAVILHVPNGSGAECQASYLGGKRWRSATLQDILLPCSRATRPASMTVLYTMFVTFATFAEERQSDSETVRQ